MVPYGRPVPLQVQVSRLNWRRRRARLRHGNERERVAHSRDGESSAPARPAAARVGQHRCRSRRPVVPVHRPPRRPPRSRIPMADGTIYGRSSTRRSSGAGSLSTHPATCSGRVTARRGQPRRAERCHAAGRRWCPSADAVGHAFWPPPPPLRLMRTFPAGRSRGADGHHLAAHRQLSLRMSAITALPLSLCTSASSRWRCDRPAISAREGA